MVALIHLSEQDGKIHRRTIYEREKGECLFCGAPLLFKEMTLDHVTPKSKGGQHTYRNLVCSCRKCNQSKGDREVWHWWQARPYWEDARLSGRVFHLHKVMLWGR